MIEMTIVKHDGALKGFILVDLNGEAFSMETMKPAYTGAVTSGRTWIWVHSALQLVRSLARRIESWRT